MSDIAYVEQRNRMRESRERCLVEIAAALGYEPDALPPAVKRALTMHGHECYQVALAYGEDAHDRVTAPAPPRSEAGVYRDVPTRVDRPFRRR